MEEFFLASSTPHSTSFFTEFLNIHVTIKPRFVRWALPVSQGSVLSVGQQLNIINLLSKLSYDRLHQKLSKALNLLQS